jgi:TonB family protein
MIIHANVGGNAELEMNENGPKMINRGLLALIFISVSLSFNLSGQKVTDTLDCNKSNTKFLGDASGQRFVEFVTWSLKYPETIDRLEGEVRAQFIIDTMGDVTKIKIVKSLRPDYDQAVIEAIKKSPKWTAAIVNNKPVSTLMTIPFYFHK